MRGGGVATAARSPQDKSQASREEKFRAGVLSKVRGLPYGLRGFTLFAGLLRDESGAAFKIQPFQREMLADFFEGAQETVIIIPKKNGKTTLLAALGLYHLLKVSRAECVIGAASRDQATLIFRQAEGLVMSAELEDVFDVKGGYRHIRYEGGRIRVLAADANTADGVIPTLALVDELHRHPSGELYGVFRDGLGPRRGQMVTISTAGATMASPLGVLRRKAHEMPGFIRDEAKKKNIVRSRDGGFVMHEWCLSDDDDPSNITLVKRVNPAPWVTKTWLRSRLISPTMSVAQWLRFACGVWTEGENPAIPPALWDPLGDPKLTIDPGSVVTLVVDMGARTDPAAVAILAQDDLDFYGKVQMIGGPEGERVAAERVERIVRELAGAYVVERIIFDSRAFQRSADLLEEEGLPMEEFPQSVERMTLASGTMMKALDEGRFHHDADPDLRAQAVAVRIKEDERGWRFHKDPNAVQPVDGFIALTIGVHLMSAPPVGPMMFGFA